MSDHQKILEVLTGIKKATDKCEHYQEYNKRVINHIREALPAYTVSDHYNTGNGYSWGYTLHVWGNGLTYDYGVRLQWRRYDDKNEPRHWILGLREELIRADDSDYEERAQQEEALVPFLNQMNAEAIDLLTRLRKKAQESIRALPEPASTPKCRHGSSTWKGASYELRQRFPLLFEPDITLMLVLPKGKQDAATQSDEEG